MSKLTAPVSSKDHAIGPDNAPITLVEYGDYQCPSCGDAHKNVKRLGKHLGDKLRFVFRNFPLEMHPFAEHAAEAAEFAAAHGKFAEMHDLLYHHQRNLEDAVLLKLATQIGLHAEQLHKALENGTYAARVKTDFDSGESSGVQGTPTFYINGQEFEDSYDYETLLEALGRATK